MNEIKLKTTYKKLLADTLTPVSIYLRLRDVYAESILLESSDYHGEENSFSYICCDPMASFELQSEELSISYPGQEPIKKPANAIDLINELDQFRKAFKTQPSAHKFVTNGIFGYVSYESVRYFEDINLHHRDPSIPEIIYRVYRYVIVIDHFKNELYIFEHQNSDKNSSKLDEIESLIFSNVNPQYQFNLQGKESSNVDDEEFLKMVRKGIHHCNRGDVFQVVFSRRFTTSFQGDEFNVYRALRSINPSPYLFYFDYGSYKIFGSSPESQLVIKGDKASIYPIAGTFKRTGNDAADAELAKSLAADEKENAEHVMLVDLARNDLSRNSDQVEVEVFKEVQFYSHVIHLVSKVTGTLSKETSPLQLIADTFPAGTLSGAPKHRALQLIDENENRSRNYYGGAIGFLGFNGDFNHAIMIRSFLSQENKLEYQAGAGIVAKSVPENELQEVGNKLAALRRAMEMAENIGRR